MPRTETPKSLDVLALAEKRLTAMIARRGVDGLVLAVAGTYDALYRAAVEPPMAGAVTVTDQTEWDSLLKAVEVVA